MDANFSLNSFASVECNDLRFYDETGRDLPYEIESIDRTTNSLFAWVRIAELANDKSIFAYWGILSWLKHPRPLQPMDRPGLLGIAVSGISAR